MDVLDRLDQMIDERHLLKHPFYTKWAEGTLPFEALQEYARQYYAFESAMPRFLSALHTRTPRSRQFVSRCSTTCGTKSTARRTTLSCGCASPRGSACRARMSRLPRRMKRPRLSTDLYFEVTHDEPVAAGVAALYAYERQVPQVAGSKIDGLERHYGITDARR